MNISLFTQSRVAHFLSSSLYFKIFIDNVEVSLQNPELKLGRTDGNDWFNFKEANYVQQTLQTGTHKIKVQIGTEDTAGCNTDYIQFTFTEI